MSPESHPEASQAAGTRPWRQQRREDEVDDTEGEQIDEELQLEAHGTAPAHHPSAPPDELFNIPTTIDPSYIISLIRKLLPVDERQGDDSQGLASSNSSSQGSQADQMEDGAFSRNGSLNDSNGNVVAVGTQHEDLEQYPSSAGSDGKGCIDNEHPQKSAREEAWEESGCILWDLAANKEHAEFMVQNLVFEVLLANLVTSDCVRITEISLGIIGNLACHEVLMNQITFTNRLLETIVNQVFLDDAPCLCEVCRLLTLGLQGDQRVVWAEALRSDNILSRVLWIAENTLNPILIEKSIGLLLAIMENQQEVAPILLPTLINLGLPSLLVNLLAFELHKLQSDRMPERYQALDSVLHAIEALSVIDDYSEEICSNQEVVQMSLELIKIPEKIEISSSCVTAAVLIANILADAPDLALEMSKDFFLLQSLLDLFPFTSDDFEARNALWNVLARLLVRLQESEMSTSSLSLCVRMLVGRSDLIEDLLLDCEWDKYSEKHEMLTVTEAKLNSRTAAIKCIVSILNQWNLVKNETDLGNNDEDPVEKNIAEDKDVQKLLNCCLKHGS